MMKRDDNVKFVVALLMLSSVAYAFTDAASGECGEFSIMSSGNETGCWDVKIDAPGKIFDGGWKDSFFYAADAYCSGTGRVDFRTEYAGDAPLRIRQNSTMIEGVVSLPRGCEPYNGEVLRAAGIVILALGIVVLMLRR